MLRKPESSYHHGDLRNALIQAGLDLLGKGGAHQLSLREAARVAGVSQAAPYRHFANKEALLAAIAQEGFSTLAHLLRKAAERHPDDPEEQFHEACTAYLLLALEHPDHFRLMFGAVLPIDPADHPELSRAAEGAFQELIRIVARCQEAGVIGPGATDKLALLAWCFSHGLSSLMLDRRLAFLGISEKDACPILREMSDRVIESLRE